MQNEESIANNVTSPESSYESYNQNLLLTQTLETENITVEAHIPKQRAMADSE